MHVTSAKPDAVKMAIDQCAAVGFEMVIMSFGSGFNIENESPEYLAQMKSLADYAKSKGVALGGYSLLASRSIDAANDVINPKTGKTGGARFGNSPCLGSVWGENYFRKLRQFFETDRLRRFGKRRLVSRRLLRFDESSGPHWPAGFAMEAMENHHRIFTNGAARGEFI